MNSKEPTSKSMLKRHAVQKCEAITNTPMTFEEWLKTDEGVVKFGMNLSDDYKQFAWEGWQASQAQQASEIEALKHDLYSYMEASNGYVNEIMKQAQTIAELKEDLLDLRTQVNYRCADVQRLTELNVELVKALDYIAETPIHPNIDVVGMFRNVARKAIAKVKGK